MSFIHVLDDSTINKIAAGEVVERPASVVKELVENAMDAKADRIEVEITAGGTSYIRVSDNGIGMSREDAQLAVQRHATSKIFKVEDLLSIDTLGFRGEALPSISAVSRFSLQTRQAGRELGTEIKIIGGKEPEIGDTGCSLGTTIKVEDLFFNTPARKKFLKTNNTEGNKINDYIIKLAISRPDISFKFINNNKTSVVTPGNGNLHDTLRSIYGSSIGDALLGVDFSDGEASIKGYISKPSTIRSNRSWQTFIVNGRIISNRAIAKAVDNAYTSMIPKAGYPMVALIMEVKPSTVDVNVHPQKSEIKFEDEGYIFKMVYKSVLDAVRPHGEALNSLAATVERPERHFTAMPTNVSASKPTMEPLIDEFHFIPATETEQTSKTQYSAPGIPRAAYQYRVEQQTKSFNEARQELAQIQSAPDKNEQPDNEAGILVDRETGEIIEKDLATDCGRSPMLPIGQVDNTYIIAQDADSLYIVDQHAAHERILYDRFAAMTDKIPSQQLLVHLFIEVSERESQLINANQELFTSLGFSLEQSGPNQYRLMEIPADIPVGEGENIIREILVSLEDMHKLSAAEIRHACLAMTACKAAIKAGFELNFRQMEIILAELNNTTMPYTCPHGRPTILKFSTDELAKMFKRTGF